MIITDIEVKNIFEEFNAIADNAQNIAIFSRDIELQKSEVLEIDSYMNKLSDLMSKKGLTETEMNLLLFLKYSIDSVKQEIQMIVNLKLGETDSAWTALILAQNCISIASTNHPFNSNQLNNYINRLEIYEKILFPKIMFASVGGIIKKTKCSICELEYEDCDHMKGKFYSGKMCVREIHEMELEEVSMVENPASKMNRQLRITYKGKDVDIFSLK
ncbi:hypothetical protein [Flavobacterium aquiphilum]|uniref:hypothetical protein n=1 Tax=Flavobacterium aquiphilum TaxID=3003261 RepID=UPI0024807FD0|nr:hypothetical protein [Flavobacterium aquiphilum]